MDPLIEAFENFIISIEGIVIVHFKHFPVAKDLLILPFTEILQPRFQGKLREFELNFDRSKPLLDYFRIYENPTAMIFVDGRTGPKLKGYRNIRSYLRSEFKIN